MGYRLMNELIDDLRRQFEADLAGTTSLETWKAVRDRWLARESGVLTAHMKRLRELPKEERPAFGQAMNQFRSFVEEKLEEALAQAKAADAGSKRRGIDVTRPGFPFALGNEHPIKRLQTEIEQI